MLSDDENVEIVPVKTGSNRKKKKIEETYQKKTQLEHIILRPDTYVGSMEPVSQELWVYDTDEKKLVFRKIKYVPALYKIFDEILVNAADNKQRDPKMTKIEITINKENNRITVWNNGNGIPVEMHDKEKMYVPTLIFGELLTSSNYDDSERKVTGGRNGYGAKLANIFSNRFVVKTASSDSGKKFTQEWSKNMGEKKEPVIDDFSKSDKDFTEVLFEPDLAKFHMESLDKDTVDLLSRRAYDIAGSLLGVKVYLNKQLIEFKEFKDYAELYVKDQRNELDQPLQLVTMSAPPRWQIAVTTSDTGFQQVSFVNSIATTKGGRHVEYITDQIIRALSVTINKKNKSGIEIKPFQIKNHLWIFVNCLIENPTFDSQTKETLTLQKAKFGSKCEVTEKFLTEIQKKCGVVESILAFAKAKAETQLGKKMHGTKSSKLRNIPKLEDANDAGTKHSADCTLILTEGDSAKALAVSGFSIVGRDKYGVFPLRGKLLNVRDANPKSLMENAEINNVIKIMGLQYKRNYDTEAERKTLRYGRLMIMTDQDQDGSHIKGLLINFVHHYWPGLLKFPFLEQFITPIVKVTKGSKGESFYSLPEFEAWKATTADWNKYSVKYYKGLGTSTSKEAKEYFTDMVRHRVDFKYSGPTDDDCIELAFSKKKSDERKEWLTKGMAERKALREHNKGEVYLYQKDTRSVTYTDFVNKELILFSNMDNERSIPSLVDGLKPGQRKVVFTCIKRKDKREVKVAQLAGSVAELSAYHHGEQSLMSTIVGLAQDFVGSNNINILLPRGQFGTRLQGGKDSASPRYIFTLLSPVAKAIFHEDDSPLLNYYNEDNQKIEPEWYIPIVPMVLINGAEGIGTGWMTKIPNFNPREIIENLRKLMRNEPVAPMTPWYKGFRGEIKSLDRDRCVWSGEIAVLDEDNSIEITELPVRVWTQSYKEAVIEPMLMGTEKEKEGKGKPPQILDYREYHTDSTVRFVVKMTPEKFREFQKEGFHKVFKLQQTFSLTSMVLFDSTGCIRKYDTVEQILKEFYDLRLQRYHMRKAYLGAKLTAEAEKLDSQARFIMEKIAGKIKIENVKRAAMIQELISHKYPSDPVETWKKKMDLSSEEKLPDDEEEANDEVEKDKNAPNEKGPDFEYLMGMALWSLTMEKKDDLLKKRDEKKIELEALTKKSAEDLWNDDLDVLLERLDEADEEAEEVDERVASAVKPKAKPKAKGRGKKGAAVVSKADTRPSKNAIRVEPVVNAAMLLKFEKAKELKERKAAGAPIRVGGKKAAAGEDGSTDKPSAGGKKLKQPTLDSKVTKVKKRKGTSDESGSESDEAAESIICDDDDSGSRESKKQKAAVADKDAPSVKAKSKPSDKASKAEKSVPEGKKKPETSELTVKGKKKPDEDVKSKSAVKRIITMVSTDEDSDFEPPKKEKVQSKLNFRAAPAATKRPRSASAEVEVCKPSTSKVEPKKKKEGSAALKKVVDESESEEEIVPRARVARAATKKIIISSDEESEGEDATVETLGSDDEEYAGDSD